MAEAEQPDLTSLTVDLLSAYFASNMLPSTDLAGMIRSTYDALSAIRSPKSPAPDTPEFPAAVGLRKSLGSPTHILSMINGKPYKMLKRHLAGHGLTPAEYRTRYSLPKDYPMVARDYSEQRRAVAARLGLGRKPNAVSTPVALIEAETLEPAAAKPAKAKPAAAKLVKAKAPTTKATAAPRKATPAKPTVSELASDITNEKPPVNKATKAMPTKGPRKKTAAPPAPAASTVVENVVVAPKARRGRPKATVATPAR